MGDRATHCSVACQPIVHRSVNTYSSCCHVLARLAETLSEETASLSKISIVGIMEHQAR